MAVLKQAGYDALNPPPASKGICGNKQSILVNNRRQVFDAIRGWAEAKVKVY